MSDRFDQIPIDRPDSGSSRSPAKPRKTRGKRRPSRTRSSSRTVRSPGRKRSSSPRKNTYLLWLLGILLFFGVYAFAGYRGVPYYIEKLGTKDLYDATGYILKAEEIRFNPFSFELSLENGELTQGESVFVKFQTITGRLSPLHLLRHDFVVDNLSISGPKINLIRNRDRTYNISSLFSKTEKTSGFMAFSDLPFFFSLNNINLENGELVFQDIPSGKTHHVTAIELALPAISNLPVEIDSSLRPHFSALVNGSPVELSGQSWFGDKSRETRLSTHLKNAAVKNYTSYLPFDLPVQFLDGTVDGTVDLSFRPDQAESGGISAGFQLSLQNGQLTSRDGTLQVKTPKTVLHGEYNPVKNQLNIARLEVIAPQIQGTGDTPLETLSALIPSAAPPEGNRGESSSTVIPNGQKTIGVRVKDFVLREGSLQFLSKKHKERSSQQLNLNTLQVKDYSTDPSSKNGHFGTIRLDGSTSKPQETFTFRGTFMSPAKASGTLDVKAIPLSKLKFLYPGKLAFKTDGRLTGTVALSLAFQSSDTVSSSFHSHLSKGKFHINDFSLSLDKGSVLQAKEVSLSGSGYKDGKLHLGSVDIPEGNFELAYSLKNSAFAPFTGKSPQLSLSQISYRGKASLGTSGTSQKARLEFHDVSCIAKHLDQNNRAKNNFVISATYGEDGSFEGKGSLNLKPFSTTLKASFRELPAKASLKWYSRSKWFNHLSGIISGSGVFSYPDKIYRGDLVLRNGAWKGQSGTVYATWNSLSLSDLNFTSSPLHIGIRDVIVDQVHGTLPVAPTDYSHLQSLVRSITAAMPFAAPSDKKKKITISPLDIQNISFTSGQLSLMDSRFRDKTSLSLEEISGTIQDIHGLETAAPSPVSFSGRFGKGTISLRGMINLSPVTQHFSTHLTIDNLSLDEAKKRIPGLVPDTIRNGSCDMELQEEFSTKGFSRSGELRCRDISLAQPDPDLEMVRAMGTGKDGVFHLQLLPPTASSETVGSTVALPVSQQVRAAIDTLLVKASISPLLLASEDYSDLVDEEFIDFVPGEFMLTNAGRKKLAQFASLLIRYPYIGLELSGGASEQIDTPPLTAHLEELERKRVELLNEKRFAEWQKKKRLYEEQLNAKTQNAKGQIIEEDIPNAILEEFVPLQPEPVHVTDTMLRDLAAKRLEVLAKSLAAQISAAKQRIVTKPAVLQKDSGDSGSTGADVRIIAFSPTESQTDELQ